jgi:RNA polymerase sigma-B factor
LLVRYHRDGELAAREELIVRCVPLARQLAARYKHLGEAEEDLEQTACLGLIKAIDRYRLEQRVALSSYAVPTIIGELKRHFRDRGWSVRLARRMQERVGAVGRARDTLSGRLGRSPSVGEVAAELGLSVEEVLEAREAAGAYTAASLDGPATTDDDGDERTRVDRMGEEDPHYELVELTSSVGPLTRALPPREREVLSLRFGAELTQSEIGKRIGVSQMQVSRLLRRALERLRAEAA